MDVLNVVNLYSSCNSFGDFVDYVSVNVAMEYAYLAFFHFL